ncbi:ABC-2 family transporter protein [Bdellovibrionota bacterium FG-2]
MSLYEAFEWIPHVLSLELRKIFSYRVAFWVRYVLGTVTELTVAYFLWGALFEYSSQQRLQGFSFHGILFYYVFASLGAKIVRPSNDGWISQEVYDGGLTRYLLYPVSFVGYKYVTFLSQQFVAVGQMLFGLGVAVSILGLPSDLAITATSVFCGILTALFAGGVVFLISASIEMVSFWQDTIWNLMAMFRFIGNLLGGILVPLVFFPAWGQEAVKYTPFPLVFSFPIRCFLGQIEPAEWLGCIGRLLVWAFLFGALATWVWKRGTKRYAGVGI